MPPAVAAPQAALDTGDLAVMRAVLDELGERAPATRRFLVVDSTVALCTRSPHVFRPPPGGCLGPEAVDSLARLLAPETRLTAMDTFRHRNTGSLSFSGPLGDDVLYISATLIDFMPLNELLAQHPGGMVVTFSAPAHVAAGVAVIVYQELGRGYTAARLAQASDGRWRVAGSSDAR